ncbi:hypothetical protein BG004_007117 [Podila humilis]|nr:hypothetical protein BG004_007117 [Podila humilis]
MNNNANNSQNSQHAPQRAGGRRGNNSGRESNMQSEHEPSDFTSDPLWIGAMRPQNTEFKVAGNEYGGSEQRKTQSDSFITDENSVPLPLDKSVAQEISSGRKNEAPVNQMRQTLPQNVHVGLKKETKETGAPSRTIYSSMGGGRNTSSTTVEFGGEGGNKTDQNSPAKEFEYREADFMPLSAESNSSQREPSPSINKGPLGMKAVPSQPIKSSAVPPHDAVDSSELNAGTPFAEDKSASRSTSKKATASEPHHHRQHDRTDSPELNVGSMFTEEEQRSALNKNFSKPSSRVFSPANNVDKTPAQVVNKPKGECAAPASSHNAHPIRHHEEPHTPEMHLETLFKENDEPTISARYSQQPASTEKPKSLRTHAFTVPKESDLASVGLKDSPQRHEQGQGQVGFLKDVDDGSAQDGIEFARGINDGAPSSKNHDAGPAPKATAKPKDVEPAPQFHSLSNQFFAKPADSSTPAQHSSAMPAHPSAMPPVHHAPPAHHSTPEHHGDGFQSKDIPPTHRAPAPVNHNMPSLESLSSSGAHTDPMNRTHAASFYHAPQVTSQNASQEHHEGPSHHAPLHIETIHMPHRTTGRPPEHQSDVEIETIHDPYHGRAVSQSSSSNLPHPVTATPDSCPAPSSPVILARQDLALGKSHDEPIKNASNDAAPVKSQADGAGLNAASYPSFGRQVDNPIRQASAPLSKPAHALDPAHAHPPAEPNRKEDATVYRDPAHHATLRDLRKKSKRARKAAKKEEIHRHQGILGSISEALVGRRKNSVSSPIMRLNEIFGEVDEPASAAPGTGATAGAVAGAAAGLGGIRTLLGSIHMPAIMHRHSSDAGLHHGEEHKLASDSAHDTDITDHTKHKSAPSKSVILKPPKIDLTHFPEEDASYPRGDESHHENPALPKSIVDVTEVHYQSTNHAVPHVPAHGAHMSAAIVQAPAVHAHAASDTSNAPLQRSHLDLHSHKPDTFAQSDHVMNAIHHIQPQHKYSSAAALKRPFVPLGTFDEELADYPRGDQHHENPAPKHLPSEVREISAHLAHGATVAHNIGSQHKKSPTATLKRPVAPLGTFDEELADYPRGDQHHENPAPKHLPSEVREISAHLAHGATVAHNIGSQHKKSPTATLKRPVAPLGTFDEELADYPRGDQRHENPAPKHLPREVCEISSQLGHGATVANNIRPQHKHLQAVALKRPAAPLGTFDEELADYPRGDQRHENPTPKHLPSEVHEVSTQLAHRATVAHNIRSQQGHSTAAMLKKPKVPVDTFPEEEADYPRGDHLHENIPSRPLRNPVAVQEVQLDSSKRHGHHDLHPTLGESAAAAITNGLESIKTMLGGIPMPALGGALTAVANAPAHVAAHIPVHRPEASASELLETSGTPVAQSMPSIQDTPMHATPVHVAPAHAPPVHTAVAHSTTPLHAVDAVRDTAPVHASPVYATPVHVNPAHALPVHIAPTKPAYAEHHEPVVAEHHAPAHVPVMSTPAPSKAQEAGPSHKFKPSEHHSRFFEIHALTDDDENYFSADEIKSPATSSVPKILSNITPSVIAAMHSEPIAVIPPAMTFNKTAVPVAVPISTLDHDANKHVETPQLPHTQAMHSNIPSIHAAAVLMGAAAADTKPDEVIVMESEIPEHRDVATTTTTTTLPVKEKHPTSPIPIIVQPRKNTERPLLPLEEVHHTIPIPANVQPREHTEKPLVPVKEMQHITPIPIAAVAPVLHTKADTPVATKSTTSTTPKVAPNPAPRPYEEMAEVKHKATPSDDSTNIIQAAAPAGASVAAAAAIKNARKVSEAPPTKNTDSTTATRTAIPELKVQEKDVVKPTPLHAAHLATSAPVEVKPLSKAANTVVNDPRAIVVPHEEIKEARKAPDDAVKGIKTTTTTTTYNNPTDPAAPASLDIKATKPVEAASFQPAVKHETVAPVPEVIKTTSTNSNAAPVPAVRPVVAAAVAAPVAASVVSQKQNTVPSAPTAGASSAQQIQQQYQQTQQKPTTTTTTTAPTAPQQQPHQPHQQTHQTTTTTATAAAVPQQQPHHQQPTTTTVQREVPMQTQQSTTAVVEPPAGYTGPVPTVSNGESVIWVKKVYTTQDYFDYDDEEAIDEMGYRKDRDVSRYLGRAHADGAQPTMQGNQADRVNYDMENHVRPGQQQVPTQEQQPQQQQTQQQHMQNDIRHSAH